MVAYDQKTFFSKEESGEKSLFPGVQASLLRLECTGGGSCQVFGKLFKQSELVQLAGISASTYAPTNQFLQGLYSVEISGIHELVIKSTGGLEVSVKTVY